MSQNSVQSLNKPTLISRSFILFFLLVFFYHGKTQNFVISSGPSLPAGMYSRNDITKKEAGFAVPGIHFSLLFEDQKHSKIFSPYVQLVYNQNWIEEGPIQTYLQANNSQIKGFDATLPWRQYMGLIGLKASLKHPGYELFVKTGIGFGNFHGFTQIQYYDSSRFVLRDEATTNTACFQGGIGFNIQLNAGISISSGVDYLYAKPNYGKVNFVDAAGNILLIAPNDEIIPVSVFQPYLGMRFYLGKR